MLRKILLIAFISIFAAVFSGAETSRSHSGTSTLLEQARRGDAQAQLQAGFAFFRQGNPVQAAYWFYAAARQNLPEAQYNMGRCCMEGYGVEKNLHRAMEYFEKAASHNILPAQLALARLYLSGIAAEPDAVPPRPAVEANETKAFALLEKLVSSKVYDANVIYAEYLIKKYRDLQKNRIVQLLRLAADQDNVQAQIILADYLLSRTDELRDEKLARNLLQKASRQSSEAMIKLAFVTENGFGAPPDEKLAFELYQSALKQNFSPLGAVRLANYYYSGRAGVAQDIPRAIDLYRQAAKANVPEAIFRLGTCYSNGIGVDKDAEQAFDLFFQAARQDYPLAQYAVGRCFERGEGTPEDQKAAFFWYHQAAMRFESHALLEVGKRFLYGQGTNPDPLKAAAFLKQALANGMTEAESLLQQAIQQAAATEVPEIKPLPKFSLRNVPSTVKSTGE